MTTTVYFTSDFNESSSPLRHTQGEAVPQYHRPQLLPHGLPPGAPSYRPTREANFLEKGLFATKRFFACDDSDEVFIYYPGFTKESENDKSSCAKINHFKSALSSLASSVQSRLKEEFEKAQEQEEQKTKNGNDEQEEEDLLNGPDPRRKPQSSASAPATTPYFGRASILGYRCSVNLVPAETTDKAWHETYFSPSAYDPFCQHFAPDLHFPKGCVIYVDVSKMISSKTVEEPTCTTTTAAFKRLVASLSCLHVITTRFNSWNSLYNLIAADPTRVRFAEDRAAHDTIADEIVRHLLYKEAKTKFIDNVQDLNGADPYAKANKSLWHDLYKKYNTIVERPKSEKDLLYFLNVVLAGYEPSSGDDDAKTPADAILDDATAAEFDHPYKWNIYEERKHLTTFDHNEACPRNIDRMRNSKWEFPNTRPLVFAFDVAGIPEAESTHEGHSKFEAQVKQIASILHDSLHGGALNHFVRVDSSNSKCPGMESVMRFSLDCMNRVRPIDQDEKK